MCFRCPAGTVFVRHFQNLCDNGTKTQPWQITDFVNIITTGVALDAVEKRFNAYLKLTPSSMPTHIFVWGFMHPQGLAFGGTS